MIIGRKVPDNVTFHIRVRDRSVTLIEEHKGNNPYKWEHLTTDDYFKDKRVLIFSLPGAFTPTCSTMQLPGFEEYYDEIDDRFLGSVRIAFPWRQIPFDQFIEFELNENRENLSIKRKELNLDDKWSPLKGR